MYDYETYVATAEPGVALRSAPASKRSASLGVVTLMLGLAGSVFGQSTLPKTTASFVWGQTGNFATNTANKGGASSASLNNPASVAVDSDGGVYITDQSQNRVLHYPKGSATADFVYGQGGVFSTGTANKGGVSQTSLNTPGQLALDGTGGLYIADSKNHRVLHYPKGSATADVVYGQTNFTNNSANQGAAAPKDVTLNVPNGLAVDSAGGLYISDQGNHRVLHYPAKTTIPDRVWGQAGSFTTNTANNGGSTGDSNFSTPVGVAVDAAGGIFVADNGNNRILHFPLNTLKADRVFGQGINNFTTAVANKEGPITANGLKTPTILLVDSAGGLYAVDSGNNRVLHYPQGSIAADAVWGQNDFSTAGANQSGQVDANGLSSPQGLTLDSAGNLYIADFTNNRILKYDAPPPPLVVITGITTIPATPVAGTQFSFTITGTNFNPTTAVVNFTGVGCTPCVAQLLPAASNTATQLGGSITLQTAGTYSVTVQNGAAGAPSATFPLTVSAAVAGAVSITSITTVPATPVAGTQFSFTIIGTNFNPATAVVNFTGTGCTPCVAQLLPAASNTATQLGGSITLQTAGTYTVTVQNGAAGAPSAGVTLLVGPNPAQTSVRALPQVAFGGGWYTALYFTNSTSSVVNVGVKLFNGDGTPLAIPGVGGGNETNLALTANGTTILEFPNSGNTTLEGWAQLTLPGGVASYGVFRRITAGQPGQKAMVPTSTMTSTSSTMIFDSTARLITAAAVANPTASAENVTITAKDASGQTIGTSTVALPPNGRAAVQVQELPGLENIVGKRGSLTFSSPGGAVVVLGLRANGNALTSIPATQN